MLFSLHKNPFRNRFKTSLTHFFDLKEGTPVEKNAKKTCINTAKAEKHPITELEIWARGMHKQGDMSNKVAAATDLALMFWNAMTEEQRADLIKRDSIRYAITHLIGYGYSWSV